MPYFRVISFFTPKCLTYLCVHVHKFEIVKFFPKFWQPKLKPIVPVCPADKLDGFQPLTTAQTLDPNDTHKYTLQCKLCPHNSQSQETKSVYFVLLSICGKPVMMDTKKILLISKVDDTLILYIKNIPPFCHFYIKFARVKFVYFPSFM